MVSNVLNFGRNGVQDWLIQRGSAIIIASYGLFLGSWLLVNGPSLTFIQWQGFMNITWIKIYSVLFILSLSAHAWIGLWTVATDYLKSSLVRMGFLAIVGLLTFFFIIWSISVLWRT